MERPGLQIVVPRIGLLPLKEVDHINVTVDVLIANPLSEFDFETVSGIWQAIVEKLYDFEEEELKRQKLQQVRYH